MSRWLNGPLLGVLMAGALAVQALAGPSDRPALETADAKVVEKALQSQSFEQLSKHQGALRKVLEHAPATYPTTMVRGDVTVIHSADRQQALMLSLLAATAAANEKRPTSVIVETNTYPMAAFLLGTYANEKDQHAQALGYLDQGLRMQPDNAALTTEKATALSALKRSNEAVPMLESWLQSNALAPGADRARVFRAKGFSLIELGRLDEAEAAYRDALKIEPGHKGAEYELAYIAKLRAGGQQLGLKLFNAEDARTKDIAPAPAATPKP